MGRLRLLPGEQELVRLRPSPAAWLGRYLFALGFVALPLALFVFTRYGNTALGPHGLRAVGLTLAVAALPVAGGAVLYAPGRHWVRFALCAAAGVALGGILLAGNLDADDASILAMGGASFVALLLTEIDRRRRTYHLTNLRIVHLGGLWDQHGWTAHYDSVLDLDVRRSPLGRLLGYASIDPVLSHPAEVAPPTKRRKHAVQAIADHRMDAKATLADVGRWRAVRLLLEAFIKDATSSEYLRADQQTQKKVGEALRALGSANVLRRR